MYITNCPLRISLFGGSTDNIEFVKKFNYGAVISFASNLKTYIITHQDKLGYNYEAGKYIINYSKREEVSSINDIANDPVRVVLDYFKCDPMTISMASDIYSQGSGLASSSSYIISLIKNILLIKKIKLSIIDICKLAHQLELKFNPYCGYQDPYGCGLGGFKKIEFFSDGNVKFSYLSDDIFHHFDLHLVFTGVTRSSKTILKDITKNIENSLPLLDILDQANECLITKDYIKFINLINQSWEKKKDTSLLITANNNIKAIDKELANNKTVIGHKLCGAGNGGFFLIFSEKNSLQVDYKTVKVEVESEGIKETIIC